MKFSNGCWLQKEGCACFSPAEVYAIRMQEDKVVLTAPTHKIVRRGDTLGGVNLTVEISAPMQDVIRVKTSHYLGVVDNGPSFDLNFEENQKMQVEDTEDTLKVVSGKTSLVIAKKDWSMTYYIDGVKKCSSGWRDLAYMKTDWKGDAYVKSSDEDAYMRQQLSIGVGELLYGMGERFTPFVKNGQTVDIWNCDGGTSTEQSYKNIPFYVSNKGYGVFVNHTDKVSFEIGTEAVTKAEFSVPGEMLDYFFIGGDSMKDVLRHYTELTGKPGMPAPWTFGLWLSTSFTTDYDEETVMSFIDGMLERNIPLKVFHFDCFWMKDFQWCDFEWDSRVFPDPKGMIGRIKGKGLKTCVWINPYIAQGTQMFEEGMEKGYFLKRPNGNVWQWDMWQPGMAIVDFTNPDAVIWYKEKLKRILDMGIDCFKTDFGERIPEDCVYANGMDPVKMHNYYTYLYNKVVYELIAEKKGKDEAILFARSATTGGQKFPVHWGGDCWSDYESMEESLRGGLSLLMSGFGFWSHDIGGFESTSTADVYKRWCAFGLLSSHSRLHGSTSYRVPWNYDEEAVDVLRFFTKLKMSLMPYLYTAAVEAHEDGIPLMRSMVLEFEKDQMCQYLDKQYMLGENLLVAPIFNEEGIGNYYLPEGVWTNYFTKETRVGGKWFSEKYGYCDIPLWVRENAIVTVGAEDMTPEYDYAKDVTLKIYALRENQTAAADICNMKGEKVLHATACKDGKGIKIDLSGIYQSCNIELVNEAIGTVSGAEVVMAENTSILTACRSHIEIQLA